MYIYTIELKRIRICVSETKINILKKSDHDKIRVGHISKGFIFIHSKYYKDIFKEMAEIQSKLKMQLFIKPEDDYKIGVEYPEFEL